MQTVANASGSCDHSLRSWLAGGVGQWLRLAWRSLKDWFVRRQIVFVGKSQAQGEGGATGSSASVPGW